MLLQPKWPSLSVLCLNIYPWIFPSAASVEAVNMEERNFKWMGETFAKCCLLFVLENVSETGKAVSILCPWLPWRQWVNFRLRNGFNGGDLLGHQFWIGGRNIRWCAELRDKRYSGEAKRFECSWKQITKVREQIQNIVRKVNEIQSFTMNGKVKKWRKWENNSTG